MRRSWVDFVRKVSSLPAVAQVLACLLPSLDRWWFRLSRGRQTLTGLLAGLPVAMVTTIGAKSGRIHTTPLLPIIDPNQPGKIALIATNFGQERYPGWYFNLKRNPQAECVLNGARRSYLAREARDTEYERYWQLAEQTFPGYRLYRQRIRTRHIPILILEPVADYSTSQGATSRSDAPESDS
ncbi:MAG: nitroreductase family deazaflavin-dependent oxidoreductase [Anaerolineales bacterium]|nr:nitroreductase family deazaflavin-dependent oxidoreductase [Anaerolineales bacterium]MCS7248255.1 nitroreductase family deazaflavin-dependent oxidoreductase [Anaerolineales bacterium]MDW8162069.1 nitroreductase family deazaflavin-dependent oxidoreductase [Anaerolineales bacterium]MDW8446241.1 nitroreductase family deazaflavin-dependent oxidoreductase [Anaerolineales bacterium]